MFENSSSGLQMRRINYREEPQSFTSVMCSPVHCLSFAFVGRHSIAALYICYRHYRLTWNDSGVSWRLPRQLREVCLLSARDWVTPHVAH